MKDAADAHSSLADGKRQRHCTLSSRELTAVFRSRPSVCSVADPCSSRLESIQNAAQQIGGSKVLMM